MQMAVDVPSNAALVQMQRVLSASQKGLIASQLAWVYHGVTRLHIAYCQVSTLQLHAPCSHVHTRHDMTAVLDMMVHVTSGAAICSVSWQSGLPVAEQLAEEG